MKMPGSPCDCLAPRRSRLLAAILCAVLTPASFAQIRVVSWNALEDGCSGTLNPGTATVLQAIGAESVNGIARAPDVLILQEMDYGYDAANAFVSALNAIHGPGLYARASQHPYDYSMPVNVVYNTATVALEDTYYFKYGTSPRATGRYRFGVNGYGDSADLYVYNTHYKAGETVSDQNRRADEAWNIRVDADDSLPAAACIIYAGDFNQKSSFEDGQNDYPNLVESPYMIIKAASMPPGTSGNGVGWDPVNKMGIWHENALFRSVHTQAPGAIYIGGGMDDRFDFQMISTELYDGEGLSYIGPGVGDCPAATHSYRAFGNNGTHNLNQNISTGTGADPTVLAALETASDHLPVVADYQIPAVMSVTVSAAPTPLIVGAAATVDVTITNDANVPVAVAADELDYALSTSGDLSGSAAGSDPALGGGTTHPVSLVAATAGAKSGQIDIISSSQAVVGGAFTRNVSFAVLGHANASFNPSANQDELTLDFPTVRQGRVADPLPFDLRNLQDAPNYTARLDLDGVLAAGDTTVLTTDLHPVAGIAPGAGQAFAAMINTSSVGAFSATYTIDVSDEDLPGATSGHNLTLTLTATVSLLGDVDLDGDQEPNDVDADDIDELYAQFGSSNPFADLDDSGTVDKADADRLIHDVLCTEYGDVNLDRKVNHEDYLIYAAHYGQAGGGADGDLNGDGLVTGADYTIYAANHGFGDGP
ncbi:MAG: choice-of-anchor D domain-containing protein [Phycisphaerae bacterium]|nr:choice-of-anchor D domain-containing protein [Phycisphaerae bacterium]